VVTAAVWAVSNVICFDLRRKGVRGFRQILALWRGNPWTRLSFFVVKEGSQSTFEPPPDDEALLLQEVRRDRLLREKSERPLSLDGSDHEAVTPEL
jgi:hypothetical protein